MPLGKNNVDFNSTGTSFRNGNPITLPHNFGNPVTLPVNSGNPIPSSGTNENTVDWTPSPEHFGNDIGPGTPVQPTPTFLPVAGSYAGTQNVAITSLDADAIYYTTDGSTPTTGSMLYSGPVSVAVSETLKALAVRAGYQNSAIGTAAYVITAPPGGIKFLVADTTEKSQGTPATSAGVDTTGADFLVVMLGSFFNSGPAAFTDSYSNTWLPLTTYSSSGTLSFLTMFYCVQPIVGPGHTITCTGGTQINGVLAAFSGLLQTVDVFEAGTDSGASATTTPVQPGSVTPLNVGDLIITGLSGIGDSIGGVACDSGFTVVQQTTVDRWETALGYLIVADTSAVNPTWNDATGTFATANIAAFAVAA